MGYYVGWPRLDVVLTAVLRCGFVDHVHYLWNGPHDNHRIRSTRPASGRNILLYSHEMRL
mgnify:CR=1 FL=1